MQAAAAPLHGLAPLARPGARLLVLGSMPGAASLQARQYYAHPRNAFWPIIESLWGIPRALPYEARTRAVTAAGIAVWDVLASCRRRTSLDAHIEPDSVVANDFAGFFHGHRHVALIAFNGGSAAALYRRHVLPTLPEALQQLPCLRLPSTSPAHAGLSMQAKLDAWSALRRHSDPAGHGERPAG